MRCSLKVIGFVTVGLFVFSAIAVPMAIGIRPIIGARIRPVSGPRFDPAPPRLAGGRYLVTAVSGCFSCHGELDWEVPGFPVKAGTEGGGRGWDREGLPVLPAPNMTP